MGPACRKKYIPAMLAVRDVDAGVSSFRAVPTPPGVFLSGDKKDAGDFLSSWGHQFPS
jgi:hypothetical protein